jgi:hypothetical protein
MAPSNTASDRVRLTLEDMTAIAANRGGRCLSESYVNNKTKLEWECAAGHRWQASPTHVKCGSWCPTCTRSRHGRLDEMHQIALARGGRCLATQYRSPSSPLLFECERGHRWETVLDRIREGHWCDECSSAEQGAAASLWNVWGSVVAESG